MNLSEYIYVTSRPYSSLFTGSQYFGQALHFETISFQHGDADSVQLVLGGHVNKRLAFLLVLEHMVAMPRGKQRAWPKRLLS